MKALVGRGALKGRKFESAGGCRRWHSDAEGGIFIDADVVAVLEPEMVGWGSDSAARAAIETAVAAITATNTVGAAVIAVVTIAALSRRASPAGGVDWRAVDGQRAASGGC